MRRVAQLRSELVDLRSKLSTSTNEVDQLNLLVAKSGNELLVKTCDSGKSRLKAVSDELSQLNNQLAACKSS